MENQRNFLTIALIAISAVLYFKWIEFSANRTAISPAVQELSKSDVPSMPAAVQDTLPSISEGTEQRLPGIPEPQAKSAPVTLITVETDMVVAKINPLGGVIERLELKEEPVSLDQPEQGFPLLKNTPDEIFITQDGLVSVQGAPNHQTPYSVSQFDYRLGDGDVVSVPLSWVSEDGVQVTKTITFGRDSYIVNVDYAVNNRSAQTWSGGLYAQFNRTEPRDTGGGFGQLPSYTGAAMYTQEDRYQKIDFDELEDLQNTLENGQRGLQVKEDGGWVAMLQHYFVGALLPSDGVKQFYSSVGQGGLTQYRVGIKDSVPTQVSPGEVGQFSIRFYLGSKEQSRLKRLQNEGVNGLARTVDYGVLTFIADPLFVVLSWLHKLVGNWGWAIILLTVLLKLLFYPLSAASYRSMGKMRKLQPRLQTLKERYKDDRQKFQMEMMSLYKTEKVNPAGGCLPILIQIPVFIALYWVLLESVEMRQAPFALWWQDLSAKDPYYVLPVLMGVSMYLMQKLNPAPMDDIQKKVFMIMPFALTFLFMTFPQGLVLYWVVNNILTMAQQWFNYKQQEKEARS